MADRDPTDEIKALEQRIARLQRVNRVLLDRSQRGGAATLPAPGAAVAQRLQLRHRAPAQIRRELEAMERKLLDAREVARSARQAKGMFLATMSHELRTPLNGMIGMLQVVLRSPDLPSGVREDLGMVLSSADNLQLLLNDILDFAQIEAGRLRLAAAPFDLCRALEEVVELFAEPMQSKGVELVLELGHDLPAAVCGDETRLRQVLLNLLSNAAKFSERGEVVLRADALPEPDMLRFSVRDTGCGIAPADLERLFQPFTQSDSTTTRRHGGTGLGLSICKELCRLLGGGIWVASRVDQGTEFWFTVRMPRLEGGGAAEHAALAGRALWIVDRNEAVRRGAAGIAASLGLSALGVRSAAECLDALRTTAAAGLPDFVIIDAGLPDRGELAAAIARTAAPARVILATAVASRAAAERQRGSAVHAVLSKPLRRTALRDCLLQLRGASSPAPRAPDPVAPIARQGARVLVAEDNPANQRVAVRSLRLLGLEADVAPSGAAALAALAAHPYDLVLMDWMMPDLDGCEATRSFRRTEAPGRHLPIIAMTANAMPGDREACLSAGMDDYLTKPLRLAQLRDAVVRWLGEAGP